MNAPPWTRLFALACLLLGQGALACELRMVYRPEARPPLMAEAPDNSGLYQTLYERVARQIGCQLRIERLPKLRAIRALQQGDADFYPGADFDLERDAYLLFIDNGLPAGDVGLSRRELPPVHRLDDLAGRRVLIAAGQPDRLQGMSPAARAAVTEVRMVSASLEAAAEMLVRQRGDFFIYVQQSVDLLLSSRPGLRDTLRVHPDCCGGQRPYHLGFAKASRHVRLEANPAHDSARPLSADNQRERTSADSTAGRFAQALERLIRQGEVQRLYRQSVELAVAPR